MAFLVHSIIDYYNDLMTNKSDPRVNSWPMMSSPVPTLVICLAYVYISRSLGPKLMANRKPFELRSILIVYNFLQTIFSLWMFYEYMQAGWWNHYSYRCQPVDYSHSPRALRMANICWWYYFSKFTEFLDTFFFVLRKKTRQISTLHVIHHGCMPFSVWMGLKFAPGGHSTFFSMLNTFVHVVMYFYYMVSAMGPQYQKYVWWKKYLTAFQMVQFTAIMVHQFQLLFIECDYPKTFMVWIGIHGVLFFFLFSDFYKSSYTKPSAVRVTSSASSPSSSPAVAAASVSVFKQLTTSTNTGFCMSVLNDDGEQTGHKSPYLDDNSRYKESYHENGHANGYVTVASGDNTDKKCN